ncbi:MAG: sigma 54-interacting transcriptional regulator [bacterium]
MDTRRSSPESRIFGKADARLPALLVAWAPPGAASQDHGVVTPPYTVGRSSDADLTLTDDKVSKLHFRIRQTSSGFEIADLDSTNGLFVQGARVLGKSPLSSPAVIRVGRAVLVFHDDAAPFLEPPEASPFEFAGRYHTGTLLRDLREATLSGRHVLLAGPSGTGKELAARALARLGASGDQDQDQDPDRDSPRGLIAHNAARFASEEEATATLFGVAPRVFSNVDPRPGLLEQAHGGALFLDEVHNLPERVQRSLLRVIEDGQLARIGETKPRRVDVRLILASNAPGPEHGLAHDLLARLRKVTLPPLASRAADIPTIFQAVLRAALGRNGLDEDAVQPLLGGDHYEAMCLDGFPSDNVRGLVDLADRLATRVAAGTPPDKTVTSVFRERFADGSVARRQTDGDPGAARSFYEQNRDAISAAYHECDGNLSATERLLRSRGIRCTRRWLGVFADRWGLR